MAKTNYSDLFDFNDNSEILKGVEGFDRLIEAMQKLLKEAKTISKEYGNSISKVADESKNLEKSVSDLNVSSEKQRKELDLSSKQAAKLSQESEKLRLQQEKSQEVIKGLREQISKLREARKKSTKATIEEKEAQREANAQAKLVTRIKKAQEGSVEQLRAKLGLVTQEWKKLSKSERENSQRGERLVRVKRELTEELKRLEKQTGDTRRNVGNYSDAIREALSSTGKFGQQLASLNQGLGRDQGGLSGALSGIVPAAGRLVPLLGAISAAGAGIAALGPIVAEVNKQLATTRNLTKLSGDALEDYTGQVRTTAKVFDQDFNEVLRSANTLSKTFGVDQQDAIDLINQGFIRGADLSGELLDSIREYSVQFKAAGLDGQALIDIIAQSTEQGLFSDKGVDAIKEAAIRLRELPTATQDALRRLGFDTRKISQDLSTGTRSIRDVIADVSLRLGELGPQSSVVGQAIADIFGGPGEDAGFDFLLTLKDLNKETEDYTKNLNDTQVVQKEYLESQEALEKALVSFGASFENVGTITETFWNNLLASAINAGSRIIGIFSSTKNALMDFSDAIKQNTSVTDLQNQINELSQEAVNPTLFQGISNAINDAFKGAGDSTVRLRTQLQLLQNQINRVEGVNAMNRAVELMGDVFLDTSGSIKLTKEELAELETALKKAKEEATTIGDLNIALGFKEQSEILRKAITDTFGRDFFGGLDDSVDEFVENQGKKIEKTAEDFKNAEKKKTAALKEEIRRREELLQAQFEIAQNAIDLGFEVFSNNIARESEALNESRQRELDAVGNNEEAKMRIQEKFDKEDLKLRQKQARADKLAALFSIAVNTARGIVSALALTPPNVPLSISIGAIGAIQAAAVATRPVPQFFKGKKKGEYEGPATWGEKGFEIMERDKKLYISPDKTTPIYTKLTDRIYTHKESKEILSQRFGYDDFTIKHANALPEIQTKQPDMQMLELKNINNNLSKIKTIERGYDKHGVYSLVKHGNYFEKIRKEYKLD